MDTTSGGLPPREGDLRVTLELFRSSDPKVARGRPSLKSPAIEYKVFNLRIIR